MVEILLAIVIALLLDRIIGEFRHFHPLVGFGNLVTSLENTILTRLSSNRSKLIWGAISWGVLVLPLPVFWFFLYQQLTGNVWIVLIDAIVLYFALGLTSLKVHAHQVAEPLQQSQIILARHYCGYMVSRDTEQLSEEEISRAVVESVLENGHDAVIATLFWYLIGGAPLVILHRLVNTLDAMWGYKNNSYVFWGRVSARVDDVLGWPSAKITALCYGIQGNLIRCIANAIEQSKSYKSLNGGWCMASGATAMGIKLGGESQYFGETVQSVALGEGRKVAAEDIHRSILLVQRAVFLLVSIVAAGVLIHWII